jgi:hypothetical protein
MKWVAIAGGWRKTNKQIENDVRNTVKKVILHGNGIVSGGALGVDYFATDEALKNNCGLKQLKILIPSSLEVYRVHYLSRSGEKIITKEQAEQLISQLEEVKKRGCLIEGDSNILNKETYFNRIKKIIMSADELVAFHINKTEGTQYTIDKAEEKGIPVKILSYSL